MFVSSLLRVFCPPPSCTHSHLECQLMEACKACFSFNQMIVLPIPMSLNRETFAPTLKKYNIRLLDNSDEKKCHSYVKVLQKFDKTYVESTYWFPVGVDNYRLYPMGLNRMWRWRPLPALVCIQ